MAKDKQDDVHRLHDMDTREVSLVDRAANKRKFLVVKSDGGTEETDEMGATAETKKNEQPATHFAYAPKADDRSTWRLPLFDAADSATPSIVLTEKAARALQGKTVDGLPEAERGIVTRKVAVAFLKARPGATTLDIPEHLKKSWKGGRVGDALERVRSLKAALAFAPTAEGNGSLPRAIGMGVRSLQFYLQQLAVSKSDSCPYLRYYPDETEITAASLAAIPATAKKGMGAILDEVETRLVKLMGGLEEVSMFDTDQAKSLTGVAGMLGQALNDYPSDLAKAALSEADRTALLAAVEKAEAELSDLQLALHVAPLAKAEDVADAFVVGSRLHRSAAALEVAVSSVLTGKAAQTDDARNADQIVEDVRAAMALAKGQADDSLKARLDRTMKALGEVAARWTPKKPEDTVSTPATTTKADDKAASTPPAGTPAPTPAAKVEGTPAPVATPAAPVEKAGRKIKKERLDRLKSAVTTLKEALADLRAGNSNLKKFKDASSALAALITELDIAKSVNGRRGIDQPGETNASRPNVGSGVQPDTSSVADASAIIGDGVPPGLAEMLKGLAASVNEMKGELAKRDEALAESRAEVARLAKRRPLRAPSGGMDDEAPRRSTTRESDVDVTWPADMNDLKPRTRA